MAYPYLWLIDNDNGKRNSYYHSDLCTHLFLHADTLPHPFLGHPWLNSIKKSTNAAYLFDTDMIAFRIIKQCIIFPNLTLLSDISYFQNKFLRLALFCKLIGNTSLLKSHATVNVMHIKSDKRKTHKQTD